MLATSALALVATIAACHKVEHGPPPRGQVVGLARTGIDHIPKGTGLIMGLSWAQLTASPLWQAMAPKLLGMDEVKTVLDEVKSTCGIDVVADFDSLLLASNLLAGSGEIDEAKTVFLIKGRWDEDKIGKCLVTLWSKEGTEVSFNKTDGLSVFERPGGAKTYLAWLAPDTFAITAASIDGDSALLGQLLHPQKTLADDTRIASLFERVDTSDAFWMVATPDGLPALRAEDTKSVEGVYVNLELGAKAHGYWGTRLDTASHAEAEARGGENELTDKKKDPMWKEYLTDTRVFVAGYDVVIEARVSETKVAELAKRLAGMNDGEWLLVLSSLEKLTGGM